MEMIYRHFGNNTIDPNHVYGKPRYDKPAGLWSSPLNGHETWKDFCLYNDYETEKIQEHFDFRLADRARILKVKCLKDAEPYIMKGIPNSLLSLLIMPTGYGLDHIRLKHDFDGMEVTLSRELRKHPVFELWDVDSLVLWNLNVIVPVDSDGMDITPEPKTMRAETPGSGRYMGVVGKRWVVQAKDISIATKWRDGTLYIIHDMSGNTFTCKTKRTLPLGTALNGVYLHVLVKRHMEYRGVKQTWVEDPRLLNP